MKMRFRKYFVWSKQVPVSFKASDKVAAFGCNGVVKKISDNGMFLEVVLEGAPTTMLFQLDGKLFKWSKCSSLEKL